MSSVPQGRTATIGNAGRRRSLRVRLPASLAVGLLDRLGREIGGLRSELSGAVVGDLLALQLTRDLPQSLADFAQTDVHAASRSRATAPRTPLTKRGASAPQYSFASSTASSIATSAGVSVNSIS